MQSEVGQAMLNCDEKGPVAFMVTNVTVDEKAGVVATGRLLSGKLYSGEDVYLINNMSQDRILQVSMYMGPYREIIDEIMAGNIPAALGLEKVSAGETVASIEDMVPFEAIRYVSEPVVTIAIESKHSRDLPKLVSNLRKLAIEDPNLVVKINEETGEYLLSGMGTLHLEISIHSLEDQGLEVMTSKPIVVYRETITKRSEDFPGKSPNRHNKFLLHLDKLDDEIISMITSGELNERMDRKALARILFDKGWPMDEARRVWALDERGNILINMTKGVQYLDETKNMIESAFRDICNESVLTREPMRGMKAVLMDAELHEDPAHRTFAQVFPAIRRAILGALLTSDPTLYEPMMKIVVQITPEYIGAVSGVISSKRGTITSVDQKEYFAIITGEIPLAETFDISQVMRSATGGKAFWNLAFERWSILSKSLLTPTIQEVRKRKGLSEHLSSANDFRPL